MKTQKTIFNVIALISAFAVVAPATATVREFWRNLLNKESAIPVTPAPVVPAGWTAWAKGGLTSTKNGLVYAGSQIGSKSQDAYDYVLQHPRASVAAVATVGVLGVGYKLITRAMTAKRERNEVKTMFNAMKSDPGASLTVATAKIKGGKAVVTKTTLEGGNLSVEVSGATSEARPGLIRRMLSLGNPFSWFRKGVIQNATPPTASASAATPDLTSPTAPVTPATTSAKKSEETSVFPSTMTREAVQELYHRTCDKITSTQKQAFVDRLNQK